MAVRPIMAQKVRTIATEEELVRAAQNGCTDSFRELVGRFGSRLTAFLHRRTGCTQDAEDLTQETLIRAYRNLESYRNHCRFSTWIYTIASNLAVSHLRKRRTTVPVDDTDFVCDFDPSMPLQEAERRKRIWDLARTLPKNQAEALELRYLEDMAVEDIARVMNKTRIHVKVLLHRARMNMAAKLQELPDETSSANETVIVDWNT